MQVAIVSFKDAEDKALIVDDYGVPLQMLFENATIAQQFLDACERTGAEITANMSHCVMKQRFDLWWDAWKRPEMPTGGFAPSHALMSSTTPR
jgi:hypothetical protein